MVCVGIFINMITHPHIYRKQIKATGRYYIGKHNGKNKYYLGSGIEWKRDLKKYVKDPKIDLIEEILEYVDDISKLNEREEWWLQSVNAANNSLYYNKTNLSAGVYEHSEITKKKMSEYHLKKNNAFFKGKQHNESTKKKMSDSRKGKIFSKESNIKRQETRRKNGLKKYKTRKDKGSYHRMYKTREKPMSDITKQKISLKKIKPVLQYDKQGNFIKEWSSQIEVLNMLGIKITEAVRGKTKTAGNFIWKLK